MHVFALAKRRPLPKMRFMRAKNISARLCLGLGLATIIFSGCSAFNYEWRQAAKKTTPVSSITGRWEGRWISEANGHNDKLRPKSIAQADGGIRCQCLAALRSLSSCIGCWKRRSKTPIKKGVAMFVTWQLPFVEDRMARVISLPRSTDATENSDGVHRSILDRIVLAQNTGSR